MAGVRKSCPGCGKAITISLVHEGEDDTTPWRVAIPRGHVVERITRHGVAYVCPNEGRLFKVRGPQREADVAAQPRVNPRDEVAPTTWLEHHDRLVKEYYDVDAEWALIKEICPEAETSAPAPKPPRRVRRVRIANIYPAIAALNLALVVLYLAQGNFVLASIWTVVAALNLFLAVRKR